MTAPFYSFSEPKQFSHSPSISPMPAFAHLHNHTEFSLLDGAAKIEDLTQKASECGMTHVAITDHGNMYGVPKFVLAARRKGLKPIVGCEFYIKDGDATLKEKGDVRYHQIMWAKDQEGYSNLVKLCSYGFTDGYYYKPRIDKEILKKHAKGLIASTCCLAGEVNRTLLQKGEPEAEKKLIEYIDIFGKENYYIEVQRHNLKDMDRCNEWLLRMARKHDLLVIATNDVHYVNEEDAEAHDLLLALQTSSDYSDQNRFRFTDDHNRLNPRFFFKTPAEMLTLFQDIPFALDNTVQLAERCEFEMNLAGDMILPQYKFPPQYADMDEYLAALTWERAPRRYPDMSTEIRERIEHELKIMKKMGYAGYFLIVQSFTTEARRRGVYVGPGRGSAAGSVVAYVLGIIDIDPLAYDLLFERFLNPERVSPPDIDIDFDDEGRQEVIDFVVEEYGRKSVSQVITYGTMGAKTALRDVGRTLNIPLHEVNRIAKMIPERPGMTFKKAMDSDNNPDFAEELAQLFKSKDPEINRLMRFAKTLEGTARHTGVHACAVIIAPGDITDFAPVSVGKDSVITTQYDGPMAEMAGLLKMDFLGLKTLSILKTAIRLTNQNHGIEIDPENIPLTDEKTYTLYQRGETVATFQFESDGMRKYLRQLKPTNIEDLIAMNALYRPGPMDNIPSFIQRKHGKEPIIYPHEMLEPILRNTYGIMVYQEQIMQVARTMGGYTMGGADLLRRAMGKKKHDVMAKERASFMEGAAKLGVDKKVADEVFSLMEKFASYGFNKSHSAAYSVLAFKTAYMKAHFPAEYMAAVLTHNVNDIKKITFFIEECRRMGIEVLQPDINESQTNFSVNPQGQIRFGLEAIKGVGHNVVEELIKERRKNGPFSSIFDLCVRMPLRTINRKTLESLAYAGAIDCFSGVERWQYFLPVSEKDPSNILEKAAQYGSKVQQERLSPQVSLFGGDSGSDSIPEPAIPMGTRQDGRIKEAWTELEKLNYEKEVIGFYLSGHPLDRFKWQIEAFTNTSLGALEEDKRPRDIKTAGIVTSVRERLSKKGNRFLSFTLEDFSDSSDFTLFGDQYEKYRGLIRQDEMLFLSATYQARRYQEGEMELRIIDIRLLTDALFDGMVRHLCLHIDYQNLDEETVSGLHELMKNHPGDKELKFQVRSQALGANLQLISSDWRVRPDNHLVRELKEMGLRYSLA
ncbi:MAG: DNA polymerase III subunit alpha [Chloroflexi bacterium AL-W]|nr:DNA polymerase III subunit alpha [Chloroflexi bacterium AL-W]